MKEEALKQRDEMVSCLLEELVKVRQGLAESDDIIRNLKTRIQELEEDKKRLRETTTDNSVAHLQDELIASKLREAEASLSLKDLKQRVQELSSQWQRQLQVSVHTFYNFSKSSCCNCTDYFECFRSKEPSTTRRQTPPPKNYYSGNHQARLKKCRSLRKI